MICLPDVNVLFSLAIAEHPFNPAAVSWWEALPARSVLLTLPVRMGVLRLLTNRAVMRDDVLAPAAAWEVWASLEVDERTTTLTDLPATHDRIWRRLASAEPPSRDLWTDAWLAALSESLGCRLVTFDRGFLRFGLAALDLLTA